MLDANISELMEELKRTSVSRKRIRRKLFKTLRFYYSRSSHKDYVVERKMGLNFLTDFSDDSLLRLLEEVYHGLPENLKQEWGERS